MSRICFISDTHSYHDAVTIPDGVDILVHCGDNTIEGANWEMSKFIEWFGNQKPRHKIFINGNHEVKVSELGDLTRIMVNSHNRMFMTNIHYLEETGIEIEGIKFWGSPYTLEFFDWAYMYPRDEESGRKRWEGIPADTDVLVTHGPPFGILDSVLPATGYPFTNAGCSELLKKVIEVKPKVHSFGHIHETYGVRKPNDSDTLFINASTCNGNYVPVHPVIVVDTDTWEVVND